MNGYIGVITTFASNFAPANWAFCNGQSLPIAQNAALFAILGKTYGGTDTTFNLPDLRGRVPVHPGPGTGLTSFILGQTGGAQAATMTAANMPIHNHFGSSSGSYPVGNVSETDTPGPGTFIGPIPNGFNPGASAVPMAAPTFENVTVQSTAGAGIPVMQPLLAINYIICTVGYFPPRN